MKKALLLFAMVTFMSMSSFTGEKNNKAKATVVAKTSINGSVMDETTGETLVGVEVILEGTDLKTYTDFDGHFTFDGVSVGKYTVNAKLISYNEIKGRELKVEASTHNHIAFKMKQANK
ncbi:carboxypeptidase-like regulatory domain-containing protein [Saccharicrinis fermentans]|uniref:TonB-linked outer membrane protein, SusC/RagA family n=1 Tax=Saccharicrinis fermentans DSM 9555 = JCM 21142 TaxID=869213 RepID=W7XUX9_9BACT|nr:carboxypeptidase-like regulatory domain-containing protein [Saccharicrinis fermentans]GAF01850.1 TonB-linked outer membrane protein, SusC/RagA family [Saccharicrinis fermentans DSM 9555 = JCM 21142]